jgi:hypothetical protein
MRYKITFIYNAGLGSYEKHEHIYDTREEMLGVLNNVFQDEIMIDELTVKRLGTEDGN